MKKIVSLGHGVLTWAPFERRTDRYGSVYLIAEGDNSLTAGPSRSQVQPAPGYISEPGRLVARVEAARESTHVGDLFRGIFPTVPKVGEVIVLGHGTLFHEPIEAGGVSAGLRPVDGRRTDWLAPVALYRAHEQSVELLFEMDDRS